MELTVRISVVRSRVTAWSVLLSALSMKNLKETLIFNNASLKNYQDLVTRPYYRMKLLSKYSIAHIVSNLSTISISCAPTLHVNFNATKDSGRNQLP